MLYEDFNAKKRTDGEDIFISRLDDEIVRNLNPKFELRDYQKEALEALIFILMVIKEDNGQPICFSGWLPEVVKL
jgi:hypothetical protein